MTIEYAHATVTAAKFALELEKLSAAEREHILKEFLSGLAFCKDCGYSDCRGSCEDDS